MTGSVRSVEQNAATGSDAGSVDIRKTNGLFGGGGHSRKGEGQLDCVFTWHKSGEQTQQLTRPLWYHESKALSDSGIIERFQFNDEVSDEGSGGTGMGECTDSATVRQWKLQGRSTGKRANGRSPSFQSKIVEAGSEK